MKVKKAERRDAIMQTAMDMFREVGFDAASMSQIAARVGGSKATLYNYFSTKEDLLLAAMLDSAQKHAASVDALLQMSGDLPTQLQCFTHSLIRLLQENETIEIIRVAISVGSTTSVGRQFYAQGTDNVWEKLAKLLAEASDKGVLRADNAHDMAMHLRCLCEADLTRALMGASTPMSEDELEQRAKTIVTVFLRAYQAED